jgi:hypothetical protein
MKAIVYLAIIISILALGSSFSILPMEFTTKEDQKKGILYYQFTEDGLIVATEDQDFTLAYNADSKKGGLKSIKIETTDHFYSDTYLTVNYKHTNKDLKHFDKRYFNDDMKYFFFFLAVELHYTEIFNVKDFKIATFKGTDKYDYDLYPDRLVLKRRFRKDISFEFEILIGIDFSDCDIDANVNIGVREYIYEAMEYTRKCEVTFKYTDRDIVLRGDMSAALMVCFAKVNHVFAGLKVSCF